MRKKNGVLVLLIAAFLLAASGSVLYAQDWGRGGSVAVGAAGANTAAPAAASYEKLTENRAVYSQDRDSVRDIYLTVLDSAKQKDADAPLQDKISFAQMNTLDYTAEEHSLEVLMQEGDASGPRQDLFGYGADGANGIIGIRGKSTSKADQKSYKVTLYDAAGLWDGQSVLNFIKHPYDLTRARNAVCLTLFQSIPNMVSLRRQYVRLHVKDLSASKTTGEFVDYGLYEQVEQPNKKFLKAHGLDSNANLYKAEYFEFLRYEDAIRETDDPLFDKGKFSAILNQRNGNSNKKLIEMLDAVNDTSRNINDVIAQYFDRDNYLTWVAMNILLDNSDTNTQNFLLYNPYNTDKWFFLPWDYDGALDWYNQPGEENKIDPWKAGISLYWGTVLHRRFFSDPDNVEQLKAKVEELGKYINKDTITAILRDLYPVVSDSLKDGPDVHYLPGAPESFEKEYWDLADAPAKAKERFYRDLEKPMPFFLGDVDQGADKFTFHWDQSYDLQRDDLKYTFTLAADPGMQKVLTKKTGLAVTTLELPPLKKGTYYWRVTVTDAKGHSQQAFDDFRDEFGTVFFGEKMFTVK